MYPILVVGIIADFIIQQVVILEFNITCYHSFDSNKY